MNTPTDSPLRELLRRADPAGRLEGPSPDDFAAAVHARIHEAGPAPIRTFGILARQLFPLAAALAVLAAMGAGSAVAYAREREARVETFATAYARSIDPWQMHAASTAAAPVATSHSHARP